MSRNERCFERFAWFTVAYNIAVVLWGALVRATGSGAGCGEHWPLCNGEVVPRSPAAATIIEFTHRITSGLALVFVIALVYFAFRGFAKGDPVRRWAGLALAFTLSEALIGAGLVLLGHVAANASVARGYSLTIHLVNTLFLLAALALTAWRARHRASAVVEASMRTRILLASAAVAILFAGVSGAIAALGDTLFRSETLAEAVAQDFTPGAHPFVRLRMLHPVVAGCVGIFLLSIGVRALSGCALIKRLGTAVLAVTLLQFCAGIANLLLLAPVWLQLVHLLLADLLWISFVLLAAETLSQRESLYPLPAARIAPARLGAHDLH